MIVPPSHEPEAGGPRFEGRVMTWRDDGVRIAMHYSGLIVPTSPEAAARFKRREPGPYEDLYLRTTLRFLTGHPDYNWLNRIIVVATGVRTDDGPMYQVVPFAHAAPLSAKLLSLGVLKAYEGYPHGMAAVHADVINRDLLDFLRN